MSTSRNPKRPGVKSAIAACIGAAFTLPALAAPGDLIGSPVTAGNSSTNEPFNNGPRIASDANGNMVATWVDSPNGAILAQRFDASGHAVGAPIQVAAAKPTSQGEVTNPVVAVNASGQFVVAWTDMDPRIFWSLIIVSYSAWPTTLHARTFQADGTPVSGDVQFANLPHSSVGFTSASVAMDDDGDFVAGWLQASQSIAFDQYVPVAYSESSAVYARVYGNAGTAKTAAIKVDSGHANKKISNRFAVGHLAGPIVVGMDGAGNFTAAWNASDSDGTSITPNLMTRSYSATGKANGNATAINQTLASTVGGLAMNRSGQYAVTWIGCVSPDGSGAVNEQICARSFQPGGIPASNEINVPADLGLSNTFSYTTPSIAIDANGNFIVGANIEVGEAQIVRLFGANGTALSPTITLPTAQVQPDSGFGVGMDAQGDAEALYLGVSSDGVSNPTLLQRISGH